MVSRHFLMEHVYMWVRYGFLHHQQQEQTLEASFHLVNNIFYANRKRSSLDCEKRHYFLLCSVSRFSSPNLYPLTAMMRFSDFFYGNVQQKQSRHSHTKKVLLFEVCHTFGLCTTFVPNDQRNFSISGILAMDERASLEVQ